LSPMYTQNLLIELFFVVADMLYL